MIRDYRSVVDQIIHPRWTNIRRKVRKALEQAYRDGLDDAAAEIEGAAEQLADNVRELGRQGGPSHLGPLFSDTRRPPGLQ
jgi:hypothetical protein